MRFSRRRIGYSLFGLLLRFICTRIELRLISHSHYISIPCFLISLICAGRTIGGGLSAAPYRLGILGSNCQFPINDLTSWRFQF